MRIPLIYLKDKQAFIKSKGMLRLAGKPLDIAKELKAQGYRLIHIVDADAISGLTKNLDTYDNLTYVINVEVECAPHPDIVMKLLSLKCRIVVPPSMDVSALKEKKLLVAKIAKGCAEEASGFHDVVLEDADDPQVKRFAALGKRVIVYEEGYLKLEAGNQKLVWGVIFSS